MELRHGSRRREDHEVFWQRITHEVLSRVTILDFSLSEAVVAGDILAHLARRGELIGVEDVLIGATALVREYTVVTGNVRHFERIPALWNALDYGRDNRLRLWFLGEPYLESLDRALLDLGGYVRAMHALAQQLQEKVRPGGYWAYDENYP
jgi:hypothetical protein